MLVPSSVRLSDRVVDRRLPGADAQGFQSAFERGDAPLQHRRGRIADAAVAKSFCFEIEQRRPVVGAIEGIRDGLIDRERPRTWSSDRPRSRRESRWFLYALSAPP